MIKGQTGCIRRRAGARSGLLALVFAALMLGMTAVAAAADLTDASKAVVRLFVTHQSWDMRQPWTKTGSYSSTCSGFFIAQGILTNAHCVTDSTYIQVELPGVADKVEAVRKAINYQIDLALIELKDPAQRPDIKPITFDDLPELRDKVVTVGYPTGGRQVSYTEGVVSRIDLMDYAFSNVASLMVQTDAAINSGNSGGPVFSDKTGASLGVATQRSTRGEGQGYFIPTPVVEQFLTDIKDGHVEGIPTLGAFFQPMENPALRASMHMTDAQSGARLLRISQGSSADGLLEPDDVMLEIDGHTVLNDGRVPFRGDGKIAAGYYVVNHQVGDVITVKILRKGKVKTVKIPLKELHLYIVPVMPAFEQKPRYYEVGGMIFIAVEPRYLGVLGKRLPGGIEDYLGVVRGALDIDELVVISSVFDASVNKGYRGRVENMRILDINGRPIKRLEDVKAAFEGGKKHRFDQITLIDKSLVVLDHKQVERDEQSIRDRYSISQFTP